MTNRITGLSSGMDTEALVKSLVKGYQAKVDNLGKNQKRHSWKMDAWKALNAKAVSFYNGAVDSLTTSDAFSKKTTESTNPKAVTITTGNSAMNTTQKMKVNSLASSAYLTGSKVTDNSTGKAATGATKLSDVYNFDSTGKTKIKVKVGTEEKELEFSADQTLADVASALKALDIDGKKYNANFDSAQGRFYMAATKSGEAGNFSFSGDEDFLKALGIHQDKAIYNTGSDAKITLNGVDYTSSTGVFEINGLTITANEVTDSEFTITTKRDTSATYDLIKGLISEYNKLIRDLDTAYHADGASKYKMLSDDDKKAMGEKEAEEWEKKIKEGLLSKDSVLSNITDKLKRVMMGGISVKRADGTTETLHLSDFGINTGKYDQTAPKDRGVYNIDGDKDNPLTKSKADLLSSAIASDPDMVAGFFSQLSKNLHSSMFELMKGTDYSSNYTIYEDKLMSSQYSSYNTKISSATQKLNAKEDYYYRKFAAMEKALSKLNSTQSSLSGFFK